MAEQSSASAEQVSAATQQTSASTQEIAAGAADLARRRAASAGSWGGSRVSALASGVMPERLQILRYDYVADIADKRAPHREAHLAADRAATRPTGGS